MIKDILNQLQYSMLADTAMLMFIGVFLAICVRTLWFSKDDTDHQAKIALFEDGNSNKLDAQEQD